MLKNKKKKPDFAPAEEFKKIYDFLHEKKAKIYAVIDCTGYWKIGTGRQIGQKTPLEEQQEMEDKSSWTYMSIYTI